MYKDCYILGYSLAVVYRRLTGTCYFHCLIFQMIETASTSETSVNYNRITRRYNSEHSYCHTCIHENLKFHLVIIKRYDKLSLWGTVLYLSSKFCLNRLFRS